MLAYSYIERRRKYSRARVSRAPWRWHFLLGLLRTEWGTLGNGFKYKVYRTPMRSIAEIALAGPRKCVRSCIRVYSIYIYSASEIVLLARSLAFMVPVLERADCCYVGN